jgi:RNA polymerase sigma factor (sigma-70 family)
LTWLRPVGGMLQIAPAMADDATQEALLAVFRALPSRCGRRRRSVRAVSVRTAVRLARKADREADREATPALAPVEPDASSLEGLVDIGDAVGRLPLAQRAVLVLRTCGGLSEQEIAATLGISAGTVKSRLHRARAAFREVWDS